MKDLNFIKNITIAHRGIHNNIDIPENSKEAFFLAINNTIPIELDIHILKDNTIVVFHDDNLKRMTGLDKQIKNCTYEEIQKLRLLNTNYSIPTLDEVLNIVDNKVLIDIEIKNDNRTKDICRILSNKFDNYNGKFIIKSFYPNTINWFKNNKRNYIRGLLLKKDYKSKLLSKLSLSKIVFNYTKPDFLAVSKRIVKNQKIINKRKENIPILVWTIKTDKDYEELKNYADSYISENIKTVKKK